VREKPNLPSAHRSYNGDCWRQVTHSSETWSELPNRGLHCRVKLTK